MKQIGKQKMEEIAKEVFSIYKDVGKIAIASDGQAFIVDNGDAAAKNHAKNNIYGKELTLKTFLREDVITNNSGKIGKAVDVIAEIEQAETIDAVNLLLDNDKRKTVIESATKRIEEIKSADAEKTKNTKTE